MKAILPQCFTLLIPKYPGGMKRNGPPCALGNATPFISQASIASFLTLTGTDLSTKAFLGQLIVLYILSLKFSFLRGEIEKKTYNYKIQMLKKIPDALKKTLEQENNIQLMAKEFLSARGSMFLGRGTSFPVALEGALKLKELSYLHAEGYPAGEMKHGPLALIEEGMPVVVLAPRDNY